MMGEEIEVGGIGYDKTLLWNYNVITSMFPLIFDVLSIQSAVKYLVDCVKVHFH